MKEVFKDLEEYPGYMISNYGNIVSFKRDVFKSVKRQRNKHYIFVTLSINGSSKSRSVSKLVAQTFNLPNPLNLKQVRNIDGDVNNCKIDNLQWCTQNEINTDLYKERREKFLKELENGERTMG